MTHVSCRACRLRFSRGLAGHLTECPLCGEGLDHADRAAQVLGLWLFDAGLAEPQAAPRSFEAEIAPSRPR